MGAALLLWGCPLDDRSLQGFRVVIIAGHAGEGDGGDDQGDAGSAGDDSGGEAGAGNGGTAGSSSGRGGVGGAASNGGTSGSGASAGSGEPSGGSSGAGGTGMPRCPDIDQNQVLDCDETLAENAAFDANANSWTGEAGVDVGWNEVDAHGKTNSGSLDLLNETVSDQEGRTMLGARQCFRVAGGSTYRAAAEISVEQEGTNRRGGLQFIVYDGPACSGSILQVENSSQVLSSSWTATAVVYSSPMAAQSAALRLVAVKGFSDPPVSVHFDNVLLKAE